MQSGSPISLRIFQFVVIHTVKGFGLVSKAEINVFLELSCFFGDPADVGNLISGSSAFSKTSLTMEFSRPEYWSGQPFPFLGDLPNPGIKPVSPTLQADSLPAEPQGKHGYQHFWSTNYSFLPSRKYIRFHFLALSQLSGNQDPGRKKKWAQENSIVGKFLIKKKLQVVTEFTESQ